MNQNPQNSADHSAAGKLDYDAIWESMWGDLQKYGPTSRHTRRVIANMLDPLQFQSALDVGCGEGSLLAYVQRRYSVARHAGMDISKAAIDKASKNMPSAEYYVGTVESYKPSVPFDLVLCVDVLEHIEDDVAFLKELRRLSSRYVLCMTVQGQMRPGEEEIGHFRNYQPGELQKKMIDAGLKPIRTVQWGFPFSLAPFPFDRGFRSTRTPELREL